MKDKVAVFWFRRDLRLEDNTGLHHALNGILPVLPIFIFDTDILGRLDNKKDRRVDYIQQALGTLNTGFKNYNARLNTFIGNPLAVFKQLEKLFDVQAIYCNRDYEPTAIARDTAIFNYFAAKDIPFKAYKDQVIFDKGEILKNDGSPYTVYTPYAKKWKETLQDKHVLPLAMNFKNLLPQTFAEIHTLQDIGFEKTDIRFKSPELNAAIITKYDKTRDYPSIDGTTKLGLALRMGTISVRKCVEYAAKHNPTWLSELVWRGFFMQILYHFPHVVTQSFKPKYDNIQWRNSENEFNAWCMGRTGYPIVDAGMRELNETGFMHNRVRMITASFLCKHLLIDWRWGEAYFAEKLNDYDLSANNGNWQWAAGCGCDAAPYFRVFNPTLQAEKFDKEKQYIKKWVPEFETNTYPHPIVDHAFARQRALNVYSQALK